MQMIAKNKFIDIIAWMTAVPLCISFIIFMFGLSILIKLESFRQRRF